MLEIGYAENSEQFFMRKQWTVLVNTENRFYECSKQIRIYSKHDVRTLRVFNNFPCMYVCMYV